MLLNLMIGLPTMLVCLALQAAITAWCVFYYMQPHDRQFAPLLVVMLVLMLGNFVQIMLWGIVFMFLGEFTELYEAVYHSGVNFSSLGYGDVVMTKRWKLLGPLEAANGVLMFAMTGAALMAILQHMIKLRIDRKQAG
ncbi:MAG TPA: ion channel [Variovorax sp.]|nr:ion channel [Variovorax sp.]